MRSQPPDLLAERVAFWRHRLTESPRRRALPPGRVDWLLAVATSCQLEPSAPDDRAAPAFDAVDVAALAQLRAETTTTLPFPPSAKR